MRSINRRSSNLQTLDFATNHWYVYRGQVNEHEYILYFKPGVPIAVIEAKNN